MFAIEGKYVLEIEIDGKDLSPAEILFDSLEIRESIPAAVPTLKLMFYDRGNITKSTPITDGTKIKINYRNLVTTPQQEEIASTFRVYDYKVRDDAEGFHIIVYALFDCDDMWYGKLEAIQGSSNQVFSTFASRNGLTFEGDPSFDNQVWIRPGIRGNVWLNDVCSHAWGSSSSCYVYCVRRDGKLVFADLNKRISTQPIWNFNGAPVIDREIPENEIVFRDPRMLGNSGFHNAQFGYGRIQSNFDVVTGKSITYPVKYGFKSTTNLKVNKERAVPQRTEIFPVSIGNCHKNYYVARAQNARLRSLFTTGIIFVSEYPKTEQILDRVMIQIYNTGMGSVLDTYSGDFFIEKIITEINFDGMHRSYGLIREGISAEQSVGYLY